MTDKQKTVAKFTLAAVALLAGVIGVARAANQQPPALGSSGTNLSKIPAARVGVDGAGNLYSETTPGYRVWESSVSATVTLIKDELGNAPVCATLHAVCVDPGAGSVVLMDSNTVSGVVWSGANSVIGLLKASSTAETCQVYDVEVQTGMVFAASDANTSAHVYWRPCGGYR